MLAKYPGKIEMPELPINVRDNPLVAIITSIVNNDVDELMTNLKLFSNNESRKAKYKGISIDFS
jgi:hypothetical protein